RTRATADRAARRRPAGAAGTAAGRPQGLPASPGAGAGRANAALARFRPNRSHIVTPAQAGIQRLWAYRSTAKTLDPRLRGDDGNAGTDARNALAPLALFLGQVAEAAHALGQFLVLFGEIFAVPLHQRVVLEPQGHVLDLGVAAAVGALRRGVVPALVVERVGDRRRAEQGQHLLLVHADLQLFDGVLFDQVALVDRL